MVNLKQIIQDLSGIAYYHPQISSFGFGSLDQITMDIETKKEPKYTKLYVIPGDVTLAQNSNEKVSTQAAVKTYVDTKDASNLATSRIYGYFISQSS
jgi:hypothetical protein